MNVKYQQFLARSIKIHVFLKHINISRYREGRGVPLEKKILPALQVL
jgi:hypothetical protein